MIEGGFEKWPRRKEDREGGKKMGIQMPRTLLQLSTQQINRFIVCGNCSRSGIDPEFIADKFAEAMADLVRRILIYNEYGHDPEVSRIRGRERKKQYRADNAETIRIEREEREIERRLRVLAQKLKRIGD